VVRLQYAMEPQSVRKAHTFKEVKHMKSRIRKVAVLGATIALMAVGPAYAFGGPNEAGNSGHFHPNSNPCQGPNDHPHCPGPH
jgi:hypothetical protein